MADIQDHSVEPEGSFAHLPEEIIIQILSYIPRHPYLDEEARRTFASACLVSHAWYNAAVPLLYERPSFSVNNFDKFVRTICPSKNAHIIRSPLAELVRALDLSRLVHQGSKSTTARLIGRTKAQLEEFVAPQATFSTHCFPALSKCAQLRVLDLSLVAESPPLPELFRTIAGLNQLTTLRLPRSSGFGVHHKPSLFIWPANLQELCLSGGIDAHFLHGIVSFPQTLRHLTIERCPNAKSHAVTHLLKTAVRPLPHLESLKIAHMPRLSRYALDGVLSWLPRLKSLSIAADYVSGAMFDTTHFNHVAITPVDVEITHADAEAILGAELRSLELTLSDSGMDMDDRLHPVDLVIAIADGALPKLRQVRVSKALHWDQKSFQDDLLSLTSELEQAAEDDWKAGRWVWDGKAKQGTELAAPWKKVAGVWLFRDS